MQKILFSAGCLALLCLTVSAFDTLGVKQKSGLLA